MPQQPDDLDRLTELLKGDPWDEPLRMTPLEAQQYRDNYNKAFPEVATMSAREIDLSTRRGRRKAVQRAKFACTCTPYEEPVDVPPFSMPMLEYNPACPEHSTHLYDPKTDSWILPEGPEVLERLADKVMITPDLKFSRNGISKWLRDQAHRLRYPKMFDRPE